MPCSEHGEERGECLARRQHAIGRIPLRQNGFLFLAHRADPRRAPAASGSLTRAPSNRSSRSTIVARSSRRTGRSRRSTPPLMPPGRRRVVGIRHRDLQVEQWRCRCRPSRLDAESPAVRTAARARFWNASITWNSGCVRVRPRRVQHLHQPLERHVGVREGGQIGLPHARRAARRTTSPAVDPVRSTRVLTNMPTRSSSSRLAAPRDRGADRDVVGAGQPGQQHRQRGVHDHEQRGVVCARDLGQRPVQVGVDGNAVRSPPAIGLHRRARPVGGSSS